MKKKGFVFMETIMVLIIVAIALASLLASYSMLQRKARQAETYDKVSDKYLLYAIATLGNTSGTAYLNVGDFVLTEDKCSVFDNPTPEHPMASVLTEDECRGIFNDYNLKYLYKIDDVGEVLDWNSDKGKNATKIYDNGSLEYIKTLQKYDGKSKPIKYIVGVFYRNEKYYYASVKL